jgi:hypothetical protein
VGGLSRPVASLVLELVLDVSSSLTPWFVVGVVVSRRLLLVVGVVEPTSDGTGLLPVPEFSLEVPL